MKTIATLFAVALLGSTAIAGPDTYSGKATKNPLPVPPTGCECFEPGFAVGAFGGGFLGGDNPTWDDSLGGGVLAEYFFSPYLGVQLSYGVYALSSEQHVLDGNLVLRYPVRSLCIAPYLILGGGLNVDGRTEGNFSVGGGVEARCPEISCVGVFADGAYHWVPDNRDDDYTIVRLGVKVPF